MTPPRNESEDLGPEEGSAVPRAPRTPRPRRDPAAPRATSAAHPSASTPVDPAEDQDGHRGDEPQETEQDPDRTQVLPTAPPEPETRPIPAGGLPEEPRRDPEPDHRRDSPADRKVAPLAESTAPAPGAMAPPVPPAGSDPAPRSRSRRPGLVLRALAALLAVAASVYGVVLLERYAVDTARGQRIDQLILTAAQEDRSFVARIVYPAISTVTWEVIIGILIAAAVFCLARRRVGLLAQLMLMVVGANVTTQIIKHLLVGREVLAEGIEITPNSFPSGHTTLAAAAAVAIVLAVPSWMRSITAILAVAWTVAAGIGTMAQGWHRPSDVAGAILVVGAWTFLTIMVDAIAAASDSEGVRAPGPGRRSGVLGSVLLIALAVVALVGAVLVALTIPTPFLLDDPGHQRSAYAVAILGILGGASALVGVVLSLRVEHSPR